MRIAIISDIHGNLEAFKEVLRDIDQSHVDEVICLGDNIGYGPEPEEVVKLVRDRSIPSVMGNHELTVVDPSYLDWMNRTARESMIMTHKLLSQETVDYIHALESSIIFQEARCVHGCPPDSVTIYLFQIKRAQFPHLFRAMYQEICFAGHTHDLQIISFDGMEVTRAPLNEGLVTLREKHQYIINVGSVGQPRDRNNNAKYVIWDTVSGTIEAKFVSYDIASTVEKILALGFPEINATRLW